MVSNRNFKQYVMLFNGNSSCKCKYMTKEKTDIKINYETILNIHVMLF